MLLVTSANLLVQLAALDELRTHPARGRFFGYLSFLAFAFTGVITAHDDLALLFFWPLLGVAFYLLLAFPEDRASRPARAARLYFIQSFADLGLVGALLLVWAAGSRLSSMGGMLSHEYAKGDNPPLSTHPLASDSLAQTVGWGLALAVAGKAALVPLHRWLTTLRSGPIVVLAAVPSFSILAAFYLLSRAFSITFDRPDFALPSVLGLLTFCFGAWLAARQENISALLAALALSQSGMWICSLQVGNSESNLPIRGGALLAYLLLVLVVGALLRAQPGARRLDDLGRIARGSRLLSIALLVTASALSFQLLPNLVFDGDGFRTVQGFLIQTIRDIAISLNLFALTRLVTRLLVAQPRARAEADKRFALVISPLLRSVLVLLIIGVLSGTVWGWIARLPIGPGADRDTDSAPGQEVVRWLEVEGPVLPIFALVIFLAYRWNRRRPVPRVAPARARRPVWRGRQFRRSRAQVGREALACVSFVEAWIFNGFILAGSSYLLLGLGELLRLTQTGHLRAYLWFLALAACLFYAALVLG